MEGCQDEWIAFWSGICKSTGLFGTVLGMGFVALLRESLQEEQFYRWGWRVPFLSSVVMGGLGVYLRAFLRESQEFVKAATATATPAASSPTTSPASGVERQQHQDGGSEVSETGSGAVKGARLPVWDAVAFHWPEILSVGLIVSFWATGFYTAFIWMAYYTSQLMDDSEGGGRVPHAWLVNSVMLGVFVALLPCMGLVADAYCHALGQGQDVAYRRSMLLGALSVVVLGKSSVACSVM